MEDKPEEEINRCRICEKAIPDGEDLCEDCKKEGEEEVEPWMIEEEDNPPGWE